jgi:hypothetical protein
MKTTFMTPFRASVLVVRTRFFLLAVALLAGVTACKEDKEEITPAAPFAGKYEAVKSGNTPYTMTVESTGGNRFRILNFAGFLNAPLEATAAGTDLTIPTQTFTNANGKRLIITGKATLAGDELQIEYNVAGFTAYEAEIVAKRKP